MSGETFKERCREANERADIVLVAMRLGMEVRTQSKVPFAYCPFHGDTGRMNLAFYQEAGDRGAIVPRAYCYSCKTQATALDLIMHQRQCDIFEALEWLRAFTGISDGSAPSLPVRRVERPAKPRVDKRKAIDHAIRRLWDERTGRKARDYLEYRGILDIAHEYQLGYWDIDNSGWSGRYVMPYLESMDTGASVWTMVGGRIRMPEHSEESFAGPKYLYTSAESREPYLWRIALQRAERDGYLILCEGEVDGLSILHSLGGDAPVAALGGVGAITAVGKEPRLAGLDLLYVADLEPQPRYNTDFEEHDRIKLDRIQRVVGENVWKLKQLNTNVRVVYPPSINRDGKTDVNDLLMAYGSEGVLDWLLPELETLTSNESERSLI